MNKRWGFLLFLVLLTLGGCHKKQPTAEAVQSSAPAQEEAGQTSSEQEDVHITATHNKTGYRLLASSLDWTPEIPLYLQELNGGLCFYDAGAGLLCTADSAGHKLSAVPLIMPEKALESSELDLCALSCQKSSVWGIALEWELGRGGSSQEKPRALYTLLRWDEQGQLAAQLALTPELFGTEELGIGYFQAGSLLALEDGCLLASDHTILYLDAQGRERSRIETELAVGQLVRARDGTVYLSTLYDGGTLRALDPAAGVIGEPALSGFDVWTFFTGDADYPLYVSGQTALYGCDPKSGTKTELVRHASLGVSRIAELACLETGRFAATYYSAFSGQITLGTLALGELPADNPTSVSVGIVGPNGLCGVADSAAQVFAPRYPEYDLQIMNYSTAELLRTQFLAGDVPDVLFFPQLCPEDYETGDSLRDLYTIIDPGTLLPKYRSLWERDGKLCVGSTSFSYATLLADSQYLTQKPDSFSALLAAASALPADVPIAWGTGEDFCSELLPFALYRFVNPQENTCDFENGEFESLLELCRLVDTHRQPAQGERMLLSLFVHAATDSYAEMLRDGCLDIGFGGAGVLVRDSEFCFGVCARGENPDGAAAFVRILLSPEAQGAVRAHEDGLPVLQSAYDAQLAQAPAADAEAFDRAVQSAGGIGLADSPILKIAQDELPAFFSGTQSAEKTAANVQSRVSLYLAEQESD